MMVPCYLNVFLKDLMLKLLEIIKLRWFVQTRKFLFKELSKSECMAVSREGPSRTRQGLVCGGPGLASGSPGGAQA